MGKRSGCFKIISWPISWFIYQWHDFIDAMSQTSFYNVTGWYVTLGKGPQLYMSLLAGKKCHDILSYFKQVKIFLETFFLSESHFVFRQSFKSALYVNNWGVRFLDDRLQNPICGEISLSALFLCEINTLQRILAKNLLIGSFCAIWFAWNLGRGSRKFWAKLIQSKKAVTN